MFRRRAFAFTVAILFVLSWIFPVGVALSRDLRKFPPWWGKLDVALAFVLVIAAIGVQLSFRKKVDKQAEETAYRIYRISTHAILAVGLVVIMTGDRVIWSTARLVFCGGRGLGCIFFRSGLSLCGGPRSLTPDADPWIGCSRNIKAQVLCRWQAGQ